MLVAVHEVDVIQVASLQGACHVVGQGAFLEEDQGGLEEGQGVFLVEDQGACLEEDQGA